MSSGPVDKKCPNCGKKELYYGQGGSTLLPITMMNMVFGWQFCSFHLLKCLNCKKTYVKKWDEVQVELLE